MKNVIEEFVFNKESIENLYKCLTNINVIGEVSVINLSTAMQIVKNCEVRYNDEVVGDE